METPRYTPAQITEAMTLLGFDREAIDNTLNHLREIQNKKKDDSRKGTARSRYERASRSIRFNCSPRKEAQKE